MGCRQSCRGVLFAVRTRLRIAWDHQPVRKRLIRHRWVPVHFLTPAALLACTSSEMPLGRLNLGSLILSSDSMQAPSSCLLVISSYKHPASPVPDILRGNACWLHFWHPRDEGRGFWLMDLGQLLLADARRDCLPSPLQTHACICEDWGGALSSQAQFEACTLNCMVEYEKKLPKLQKDIEAQLLKIRQ